MKLGDVVLVPSARVSCVALAQDGGFLLGRGWTVAAEQASLELSSGRAGYSVRRWADPVTGLFVFEGVPAGLVTFLLQGGEASVAGRESLQVDPGGEHFVEITSAVPEVQQLIHVQAKIKHFGAVMSHDIVAIEAEDLAGRRFHARAPSEGSRGMTWHSVSGVPTGEYTVHVRGDAFQQLAIAEVRPGDFVTAQLVGNVSARLALTRGGELIPPSSSVLEIRMRTEDRGPLPRRLEGVPSGDAIVFEGLLPGAQEWTLHLPGTGPRLLGVLEPLPGEARTVHVELESGDTIEGVVFERRTRRPLGGARVVLARALTASARSDSAWDDEVLEATTSDPATGHYRFAGLPAGEYRLRAELGPLLVSAEARVTATGSGEEHSIDLGLEAGGGLVGRLRMAPGTALENLSATVAPLGLARTANGRVRESALRARVASRVSPDGGFRSGLLPPGPARVVLYMPELHLPTGPGSTFATSGGSIDLGVVEVLPGQWTEHEFDATASSPGSVEVVASLDGRAAWGHVVELQQDRGTHMTSKAGAVVPPSGRVVLGPLVPGKYILTLRPTQASWVWTRADRVIVTPGSRTRAEVIVTVERGALTLVDREGRPVAHEEVRIRAVASPPPNGAEFRTDGAGRLRLALPPGRYSLARGLASGSTTRVEFAWPPGPEHARGLELPR
ncbi:MAG: carboxypeptidase regulatory-like domain-containing protein [Planctomycetes bacterium]|nr:carboxypeptidase regulatory-like domain-containing protein [Planctomycetota bacterium]